MFVLGGHCGNQDWRWSRNGFSWQKHRCCQSLSPREVLWKQRQSWSSDQIWCWQWIYLEQGVGLGELWRSFPTLIILWLYVSNLNPVSGILWLCQAFAAVSFSTNTKLRSKLFNRDRGPLNIWYGQQSKARSHPHNLLIRTVLELFFILFCLVISKNCKHSTIYRLLCLDLLQFVNC